MLVLTGISLTILQAACASVSTSGLLVTDAIRVHLATQAANAAQRAATDAAAAAAMNIAARRLLGGDGTKDKPLPCAARDGSIPAACAQAHGLK